MISKLFERFDIVNDYMDNVLVITKHDLIDHIEAIENFLQKLAEAGLKVNMEKSFFGYTEMDYLGLWACKNGVITL